MLAASHTRTLGSNALLAAGAGSSNTELNASAAAAAGGKAEGALTGAWRPPSTADPIHPLQHEAQEDRTSVTANPLHVPRGAAPSSVESPGCPDAPVTELAALRSHVIKTSSAGSSKQPLGNPLEAYGHGHELHTGYTDLMDHSPFFMTAIAVDGSKMHQSPLSIRYYGDVSRSHDNTPGGEGHGAELLMHLLRRLFCLEGELLLEGMLRIVLGGREGEEAAGSSGWHRTMRVPACCSLEGGDHEQPPACGQAKPRPMVQLLEVPASNTPQTSLANAQQSNGGPPRSESAGLAEVGDHAASEKPSSLMSSFTEAAAAVSIAARNAPKRMRTLLDRSMSSKFLLGTGDNTLSSSAGSPNPSLDCSRAQSLDVKVAGMGKPPKPRRQNAQSPSFVQPGPGAARRASDLYVHMACATITPGQRGEGTRASTGSVNDISVTTAPADISFATTDSADMRGPPDFRDVQDSNAMSREGSSTRRDSITLGLLNSMELMITTGFDFTECLAQLQTEEMVPPPAPPALPHPHPQAGGSHDVDGEEPEGPHQAPGHYRQQPRGQGIPSLSAAVPAEGVGQEAGGGRGSLPPALADEQAAGGCSGRGSFSGSQRSDSDEREQWHEVFVKTTKDAEGRQLLLIYQSDVTVRTQLETAMVHLTEMQLETLCQIFPRHVIEFLSCGGGAPSPATLGHLARSHEDVSILFMDIVGFTSMSKQVAPDVVMTFLNTLFSIFDDLCAVHGVFKVETAGDCFIVSSGLLSQGPEGFSEVVHDHDPEQSIANIFSFAKDMLASSRQSSGLGSIPGHV